MGKAMRRLMSNGSAGNSKEVFDDMVSMHPERKDPLEKHMPTVPRALVTEKMVKKYLYRLAAKDQSSPVAYGWCAGLLLNKLSPEKQQKRINDGLKLKSVFSAAFVLGKRFSSDCVAREQGKHTPVKFSLCTRRSPWHQSASVSYQITILCSLMSERLLPLL